MKTTMIVLLAALALTAVPVAAAHAETILAPAGDGEGDLCVNHHCVPVPKEITVCVDDWCP